MRFEDRFGDYELRCLYEGDWKQVLDFYYANRESFDKYEARKADNFYTENFIRQTLLAEHRASLRDEYVRYFLFSKKDAERIIATMSFANIRRGTVNSCIIGYKVDKDYRRLGIASAMIREGIKIMHEDERVHRVEAYIHPDNEASLGLVEKLGFKDEGWAYSYTVIRDEHEDFRRFTYICN